MSKSRKIDFIKINGAWLRFDQIVAFNGEKIFLEGGTVSANCTPQQALQLEAVYLQQHYVIGVISGSLPIQQVPQGNPPQEVQGVSTSDTVSGQDPTTEAPPTDGSSDSDVPGGMVPTSDSTGPDALQSSSTGEEQVLPST